MYGVTFRDDISRGPIFGILIDQSREELGSSDLPGP